MVSSAHLISEYSPRGQFYIYDQLNFLNLSGNCAELFTRCKLYDEPSYDFKINFITGSRKFYSGLNQINEAIFDKLFNLWFSKKILNFDVLHVHFGNFGIKILDLMKKRMLPALISFYGSDAAVYAKDVRFNGRFRELYAVCCKTIAICNSMKEDLIESGCPEDKVAVWHLGVNTDEDFTYIDREVGTSTKFFTAARFIDKKGYETLLPAFKRLVDSGYSARLIIMGYGPLKNFIESFIYDSDLSDKAEVVDTSNNLDFNQIFLEKLKEADVFLYPAIKTDKGNEEGTPVCIISAMSTGMPVIASNVGGISEIIDHDVNGLLIEQRNVETLSKAMISLMEDVNKRKKFGLSAREKIVKEFNIKKQTDKLVEIYGSVL